MADMGTHRSNSIQNRNKFVFPKTDYIFKELALIDGDFPKGEYPFKQCHLN